MNSIDTVGVEGIKKTVLLSTSLNGKRIATPALISGRENQDLLLTVSHVPQKVNVINRRIPYRRAGVS